MRGKDLSSCRKSLFFVPKHGAGTTSLLAERKANASEQSFQIFTTLEHGGPQFLHVCSQDQHKVKVPELKVLKPNGAWKGVDTSKAVRLGNIWRCPIDLPAGTETRLYFYTRKPADEIPGFGYWVTQAD